MTVATSIRTGCVSWTYADWIGSFYPQNTNAADFLTLYSQVFDIVEIDSSFYHIPTASTIKQWKEKTPGNFLFTSKLSRRITHELRLNGISEILNKFEKAVSGLGTKLACIIAQLPPNFKFEKSFEELAGFLEKIDPKIQYAIEFRNISWFRRETYDLLRRKGVSLVWSVNDSTGEKVFPEVTSDLLYLRLMGKFGEFSRFNRIQKEKREIRMQSVETLKSRLDDVGRAFILASNHFEGFAPSTVNVCREQLGLSKNIWV